jgi:3-hydroxyisobutyrate dehydrogenase
MGAPIARNLRAAGFGVRAWNRTRERAESLREHGAKVLASAATASARADVVITLVSDAAALEETMVGSGSALEAMQPGALWIQSSTVGVAATELAAAWAAGAGVGFVDAPLLGTKEPAEKGELVVLAAGPRSARERCEPVFEAIGRKTLWLGAPPAGTKLKLVCNAWLIGLVGVLAEAIAFARALDVEPQRFLEAIEGGPVDAGYAQIKGKAMATGRFPASFKLSLAQKDAGLALLAAERESLELPLLRSVSAAIAEAVEAGHGERDLAAVYRAIGNRSVEVT